MKKQATRSAQYPLFSELVFNFNDWVVDSTTGVKMTMGSSVANSADPAEANLTGPVAGTVIFDAIKMPRGAVITGGEMIVDTAYVGPTAATVKAGIAGNDAALLAATSVLAAGRTPILLTSPALCNGGADVRLTLNYTVANATAGKVRFRVFYTIDDRANEVIPS